MIGRHVMTQELFGKKAVSKLLLAAAMGVTLTPSAWAAAGDYTPLGIKSGPFTIFLNGGVGIEYNNNIFALPDDEADFIDAFGADPEDFLATIGSGIEARGKFSGGSTLDLYADGEYGAHFEYDNANYFDAKIGMRSRTFFTKAVSLRAKSEYSYEHEPFGLLDTPTNLTGLPPAPTPAQVAAFVNTIVTGAEPTTLSKVTGALALDIKPGRTGFTVGADATGRFFNDKKSVSFEYRNYWDVNVFAEFTQDLDKTTGFFLRANGNGRAYPDRSFIAPSTGNNPPYSDPYDANLHTPGRAERDSLGFDLTAGARVKASGTINLEAFAGYINKNFEDDQFDTINDFVFGANMKWTPSSFFEMRLLADRSILETTDALSSSFIASKAETTLSIFPMENLTFWTTGRYVNRDYQSSEFSQGFNLPEREDDVIFAEIGGEFKINRNVGLGLHYNYHQRESNISDNAAYTTPNPPADIDFDRQTVMFEVKLAR